MSPTSTPMAADSVVSMFFTSIEQGMLQGVTMFWNGVVSILIEHWLLIGIIFIGLFCLATLLAFFGDWSALGSLLYNTIYLTVVFVIGLLFGPETFLSNWFGIFTALMLYPITYLLVGWILRKTGLKY